MTPEHKDWPEAADDQGIPAVALWWRGNLEAGFPEVGKSMAIIGSRDATEYGRQITTEIACKVAQSGMTVFSGGFYGIDAAAHEAAPSVESHNMPTVAAPTRMRFLNRNRLMASLVGATVVT